MQIIELLTPAYEAAWLPWAVQYFFLVGIATGAALLAVWGAWSPAHRPAAKALPLSMLVLAITAMVAPVSLLADLHQPARFWHFYAHFTPWSWMSLGALLLPPFAGLSLAMCAAWWLGRTRWMRALGAALLLSALSIVIYTGAEISVVKARPLWNNPWVPVNLALTAWLATVGALLVASCWLPAGRDAQVRAWLARLGLGLSAALLAVAGLWAATGLALGTPSFQAAARLHADFPVWRASLWLSVLLGAAVLLLWCQPRHWAGSPARTLALGLTVAAAAWGFRWALFMGVQGVPKYGAGLYVYRMPLGGDGLMGMLGIFGLCLALATLALWALERFPARSAHPAH